LPAAGTLRPRPAFPLRCDGEGLACSPGAW